MVNVFDASSLSSKDMRQWLRYNQIAHYLMSKSDFEIKIVQKIKCLICISKGLLLLKHPVVWFALKVFHYLLYQMPRRETAYLSHFAAEPPVGLQRDSCW